MSVAIFRKFLVLFFINASALLAQSIDNVPSIELGQTNFPIERPFTISVVIPNSETRTTVAFPDITGFTKRGISTSVTPVEIAGKSVNNQVITQSYQARAPGRFLLQPFNITVNDETVRSEGAILIVQSSATASNASSLASITPAGAAFLSLRASQSSIYAGEGVSITLSFFVADNYPYELMFQALDKQLQAITKKIRPANSWEENQPISELKPVPVVIKGKKFREYRLFQSTFFPLSNQSLRLPAVSLQLGRRPVIGPPTSQPETVGFTSKPIAVAVRSLPAHPLRGRVPVGTFQLEEGIERYHVTAGKSVRYTFSVSGKGNIATLPAPVLLNEPTQADIFPPEERYTISHTGGKITGQKTFTYFIVPHQNGPIPLANRFQWIYFDTQTARYDTLRPHIVLQVGDSKLAENGLMPISTSITTGDGIPGASSGPSLYAGLETTDSAHQPVSIPVLVRAIANVLIVLMLVGMIVVFFRQ
jgi:hypothetical protein